MTNTTAPALPQVILSGINLGAMSRDELKAFVATGITPAEWDAYLGGGDE